MEDFFEIDFLKVGESSSGDAICVRYSLEGEIFVHVIDGGFKDTGQTIVDHINSYYGVSHIDNVVITHNDRDHTGGIETVLRSFKVKKLRMNLPWVFADELLKNFETYNNKDRLISKLKSEYKNLAKLEEIADELKIPINCAFQGDDIGEFTVMAPTEEEFLELVLRSEKTPKSTIELAESFYGKTVQRIVSFVKSLWGKEYFPKESTSEENEMSIVQYGNLCEEHILLTGDTGRIGLNSAFEYATSEDFGGKPEIDIFQIPHHGSRRNVSTEVLNKWFGTILPSELQDQKSKFTAFVSAAKNDSDHPRKAVIRAMIHRGGKVISNEDQTVCRSSIHAPKRPNWYSASSIPYPNIQEK